MLSTEYLKKEWFSRYCPATQRKRVRIKRASFDAHGGLCADRACGYLIARCTQGRYATHFERWVRKSAIVVTRTIVCTHERLCAQQMHTTSETQRCLLKCNVQQRIGAIVVTHAHQIRPAVQKTQREVENPRTTVGTIALR